MNLIEYADSELMAMDLASLLAGELENVLLHEDRATLIVPGGTTPGPVFDVLCDAGLDWARVDVVLSDERWLPQVHVRSNARLVRERLLSGRAAAAMFHPLFVKADQPEDVLAEIEAGLVPLFPAAVALLGMGADMHTASLFPGAQGTDEALSDQAPILVPVRGGDAPEPRVTLSARVLNQSLAKHIVMTGRAKRAAVEKAAHMFPENAPVAAILPDATIHWAPE